MENDTLIKRLKSDFETIKKEHTIKISFEDLDKEFYLINTILSEGYVPVKLTEFISKQACNTMISWNNYLHSLCMPNPQSMISITENQMITEEMRGKIIKLMTHIMAHTAENNIMILESNSKKRAAYIDASYQLWISNFKPQMMEIMQLLQKGWVERLNADGK
jgi:hypothetical protein